MRQSGTSSINYLGSENTWEPLHLMRQLLICIQGPCEDKREDVQSPSEGKRGNTGGHVRAKGETLGSQVWAKGEVSRCSANVEKKIPVGDAGEKGEGWKGRAEKSGAEGMGAGSSWAFWWWWPGYL